jgi:hypothetical protein
MYADDRTSHAPLWQYPMLAEAVARHVAWARDFASAGDLDAAHDEWRDVDALVAEVTAELDPEFI